MQGYAILFSVSFTLCFVIVISSGYGFTRRAALDKAAVQSAHTGFVPRVGVGCIPKHALFDTTIVIWFIPLAVVFDIEINGLPY